MEKRMKTGPAESANVLYSNRENVVSSAYLKKNIAAASRGDISRCCFGTG